MKRREFIKKIGLGSVAAVIVPTLLLTQETPVMGGGILSQIEKRGNVHDYHLTTKSDIREVINALNHKEVNIWYTQSSLESQIAFNNALEQHLFYGTKLR